MLSRLPWWPSSQPSPVVRDQADGHASCVFCHHCGMERGYWRAKPRQSKATSQSAIVTSDSAVLKNEQVLPIAQSGIGKPAAGEHETANCPRLLSLPSNVSQCSFALLRSPRQSTAKMKAHWAHSFLRLQNSLHPIAHGKDMKWQTDRWTDRPGWLLQPPSGARHQRPNFLLPLNDSTIFQWLHAGSQTFHTQALGLHLMCRGCGCSSAGKHLPGDCGEGPG